MKLFRVSAVVAIIVAFSIVAFTLPSGAQAGDPITFSKVSNGGYESAFQYSVVYAQTTDGDYQYFGGMGYDGDVYGAALWRYDTVNDTWQNLTNPELFGNYFVITGLDTYNGNVYFTARSQVGGGAELFYVDSNDDSIYGSNAYDASPINPYIYAIAHDGNSQCINYDKDGTNTVACRNGSDSFTDIDMTGVTGQPMSESSGFNSMLMSGGSIYFATTTNTYTTPIGHFWKYASYSDNNAVSWEDIGAAQSFPAGYIFTSQTADADGNIVVTLLDVVAHNGAVEKYNGTNWSFYGGTNLDDESLSHVQTFGGIFTVGDRIFVSVLDDTVAGRLYEYNSTWIKLDGEAFVDGEDPGDFVLTMKQGTDGNAYFSTAISSENYVQGRAYKGVSEFGGVTTTTTTTTTSTTAPTTTTTASTNGPSAGYGSNLGDGTNSLTSSPGGTVTIHAQGFAPDSDVTVTMRSTPVVLGTARTNSSGSFVQTFTIPSNAALGAHQIILSGRTATGDQAELVLSLNLVALPNTGVNAWAIAGPGTLVLLSGSILFILARRRRQLIL